MTNVNRRLVTDEVRELVVSALLSDPSYVLGRRYAEDAFDWWLVGRYNDSLEDGREAGFEAGYLRGFEAGRA